MEVVVIQQKSDSQVRHLPARYAGHVTCTIGLLQYSNALGRMLIMKKAIWYSVSCKTIW